MGYRYMIVGRDLGGFSFEFFGKVFILFLYKNFVYLLVFV